MAFVALKALKWALKGQELASDTLEILHADALLTIGIHVEK